MDCAMTTLCTAVVTVNISRRSVDKAVARAMEPAPNSAPLHFSSLHAQSSWTQFQLLLWRNNLLYWRSPQYNVIRLGFTAVIGMHTRLGTRCHPLSHIRLHFRDPLLGHWHHPGDLHRCTCDHHTDHPLQPHPRCST